MSKELGKKIRAIRLKRNLSQSTMADMLGYSGKGMISRLENDSAEMSYEKLMLLLSKFGDDFSQEEEVKLLPISERECFFQTERLSIKKVGFKELDDLLSIKVANYQIEFVAENSLAIAEAYAAEKEGTKTECFVAYNNKNPIGFISVALGSIGANGEKKWMKESYCLWRIMIDSLYQRQGYGKEFLKTIIEWCSSMPLGSATKIYTSCCKNNYSAISLYHSCGFKETGETIDNEIVLVRNLKGESDDKI